jgi:hypothetical protein
MLPTAIGASVIEIELVNIGRMQLKPSLTPSPGPKLKGSMQPRGPGFES